MTEIVKGGQGAKDDIGRKLMAVAYGPPGSGKTAFGLSFPSPIFMVNLDRDPSELFRQLPEHYEIHYERIPYDVDITPATANSILSKVDGVARKAIAYAKANPTQPGTFLLDGADLLWEYVKVAKLPSSRGEGVAAREFADANSWMSALLGRLYFSHLHVCWTALSREIWKKQSSGSGTYEPEGFKHRGRWMTSEVYLFSPEDVVPTERPVGGALGQSHRGYIKVSKFNEQALVRNIVPNISFKLLYKLSFGDLPPDADKLWTPS